MRNPLRNLVARPSDKPSLRDRLAATRERWRRRPAAVVSPDLARLIADADWLTAEVRMGSDGDDWPDQALVRHSVEARAAVIQFPSAGAADTGAKLASLRRVHGASDIREDVQASLSNGDATYDDLALIVVAELLEMGGIGPANVMPLAPRPDPIFAAVDEARRLSANHARLNSISAGTPDNHPSWEPEREAHAAMWDHVRGVVLKTVPTTGAGCVALARFACEFTEDQGVPLDCESNDPVLALIARSPAL